MYRFTALWFCLTLVCGAILFQISQKVVDHRNEIEALQRDTEKEEDSLRVLKAEWSYLNQPDRLQELANKHLKLVPMSGRDMVSVDQLDAPPPAAVPDAVIMAEKPQVKKTLSTPPSAPAPAAVIAKPVQPVAAPSSQPVPQKRAFGDLMKSLGGDQ